MLEPVRIRTCALWRQFCGAETRWALEYLSDPPPQLPIVADAIEKFLRGRVALAQGETVAAISLLEASIQAVLSGAATAHCQVAQVLARAWRQQGDLERALRVLDEASRLRTRLLVGPATPAVSWLHIEAERARLNREMGRDDEAAHIEAELLKLLAVADEDHQILRDLRDAQTARQSAVNPATP